MALYAEKDTNDIHNQEESLPPPSTMPDSRCRNHKPTQLLFWLLQFLNPLFYVRLVQQYAGITSGSEYSKRITESPHNPTPVPADATVIDCGYTDRNGDSRFSELPQLELESMDLSKASGGNSVSIKSRHETYSEENKAANHISNDANDTFADSPAESVTAYTLDKSNEDKKNSKPGRKNGKKGKRGKSKNK
ncbi:hypothetical protein IWW36_004984 [Coemansia brasiliensis]|uniref:Uncharacterized protein n=1 Tax=Coemansia brasiliensis TaxID=2650707 RepID=A0A9W8LXI7_9FUNG|nr:hypothetical protein IWW36_004984 [Coemansia brasiliensis]